MGFCCTSRTQMIYSLRTKLLVFLSAFLLYCSISRDEANNNDCSKGLEINTSHTKWKKTVLLWLKSNVKEFYVSKGCVHLVKKSFVAVPDDLIYIDSFDSKRLFISLRNNDTIDCTDYGHRGSIGNKIAIFVKPADTIEFMFYHNGRFFKPNENYQLVGGLRGLDTILKNGANLKATLK